MCIMEVRPGQKSATILQAMAHNTSTIERDLDMLYPILEARGSDVTRNVRIAHSYLKDAYQAFLTAFSSQVTSDLASKVSDDTHDELVGSERELKPVERVTDQDADIVSEAAALGGRAGFSASQWVAEALSNAHKAERYESRKDTPVWDGE